MKNENRFCVNSTNFKYIYLFAVIVLVSANITLNHACAQSSPKNIVNIVLDAENHEVVVDFDPRFDTGRKEFSFIVDVDLNAPLDRVRNILKRSESFYIEVLQDNSIRWTLNGTDRNGALNQQTLTTAPLATGAHRLLFTSQGFKNANAAMHNQIYVDGAVAADSDNSLAISRIYAMWSSESGMTLGDSNLNITYSSFHTLRFWPDEID